MPSTKENLFAVASIDMICYHYIFELMATVDVVDNNCVNKISVKIMKVSIYLPKPASL